MTGLQNKKRQAIARLSRYALLDQGSDLPQSTVDGKLRARDE